MVQGSQSWEDLARISAELDAALEEENDDATPTVVASIEENEIKVFLNEVESPLLHTQQMIGHRGTFYF